jgi:CHAT domain-containing protein
LLNRFLILLILFNCSFIYAQNDTISQIIGAYDKWDNELCNNLIEKFSEKNIIIITEQDSINYNIFKCIKGYQMPKEKFRSVDYSSQYYNSIQYLCKKELGDYLTSFVNDLYYKSDLYTSNSSTQYKIELLELLENSLKFTIKDLNLGRFYSKIEHFNTLRNISFLYFNIKPNNYDETLYKINEALNFYETNKSFFESKNINSSNLYFLLKLKSNLLYKTHNLNDEIPVLQKTIEILYEYKDVVDTNYKERISEKYVSLIYDSFKISNFTSLIYLINKFDNKIPEFELSEIKYLLEANTIDQKLILIEKLTTDLENQIVSPFKQEALDKLISYLVEPYGNINEIILNTPQEKKIILHCYYIKYLISTNNNWSWKLNPQNKIYSEKVHLDSFLLIYKDFKSDEVDINFKEPIDYLKRKHEIIKEIIETNNPNKSKLLNIDFLDKINYEIREHQTKGQTSDDEFIIDVLNTNISIFRKINPKYKDLITLLELINTDILKLILGLDYYVRIEKTNKLRTFIKSKLTEEINIEDLNLRIDICNNLEDYKKIKNFTESIYKIKKITSVEYIKLLNSLNFLEYDIFEEQHLNIESNKTKFVSNDFLIPLANKNYNFFISNIDVFNDYNDYFRIIELIKKFNIQPNIQLINKYLTFYNNPGNLLTNEVKFSLDQNLGELYYRIKNYSKARQYFYASNANPLVYEDHLKAIQKWDILIRIYFCTILDSNLSKEEVAKTILYLKDVFESDIERIKKINSENISNTLREIIYKYNIICLHELREQKELLKEKKILLEQLELNKTLKLYDDFYNERDLIICKSKLNEVPTSESFKLITDLYVKYNKKQDISFALACEEIKDYNSSFNIQLNIYSIELINNLNYLNKLSFTNQIVFFNDIWDNRQYILRSYFILSEEEKQKNLNRLIEYFILSDNVDGNNSNLYANNDSTKIDELILEKKKLFNTKLRDEDYNKISNNIDLLQQNLKFKESNINWNLQLLINNLKENQAYIRVFSSNGYYAFIITKNRIKLIDLNGNNIDFQKVFNAYMMNLKEQIESPLAYDIFYSKIFNALPKEANELFFQNEGVYINLNPDGFKSNSTQKYLIEDYDIHTINTSYLFNNLDSNVNFENALFIGNPKFQIEETSVKNTSIVSNNTRGSLLPLPNTQNEVIEVSKQLNNINIKTNCLLQNDATEENLNRLSSSFDLIHIATHGFYKDDGSDKINQYDFGLYLAGALDYINNNQVKSQMIDEGIVYAPEIELLNLSKTKLVVLSACETGFGRQSKIGKISLSSSFIMAGSKNVLSTLWKVDDKVTMEFINEFYKKLLQLKNIKSALRQTQLEFLEKYKSPYYWAPFMLLQNRG